VFYFFAIAQQPTTDKHLDRIKHGKNRPHFDKDEEARTGNSGFKKLAVQYSADTWVVNQSLVLRINTCLPAGRFVVKIATFAKPQNITSKPKNLTSSAKEINGTLQCEHNNHH
jgi:hypothetical protein